MAVEKDAAILQMNMVAGHSHHALDESVINIDGVAKNDNVAALDVAVWQHLCGGGVVRRVGQLIHQQMVANKQRVFHGTARDNERLGKRGGTE